MVVVLVPKRWCGRETEKRNTRQTGERDGSKEQQGKREGGGGSGACKRGVHFVRCDGTSKTGLRAVVHTFWYRPWEQPPEFAATPTVEHRLRFGAEGESRERNVRTLSRGVRVATLSGASAVPQLPCRSDRSGGSSHTRSG